MSEGIERKRVALTFDNGPTPGVTEAVLDELAARDITATFFMVGTRLREPGGYDLARRVAAAGHRIGHHTATHTVQLGSADDPEEAVAAEISAIESDIDALSGASDTTGERLFRPYAGGGVLGTHVFSPAAVDYLQQHRYTCVLWNVLPHDWDDPTGWVDTGFEQTAGTDWSVVVLHDIDTGAMRRLPEFLDGLDAQGAEFVTEFPGSCVPIKQGRPQWSMAHLTSSPDHRRRS